MGSINAGLIRFNKVVARLAGSPGLGTNSVVPTNPSRSIPDMGNSFNRPDRRTRTLASLTFAERLGAANEAPRPFQDGVEVSLPGQMVPLLRTAVLLSLVVLFPSAVHGEVARVCEISYQLPDGSWSTPERREVIFRTGREMNQSSTTYFSYDAQEEYAVVVWGQGNSTIIDLDAALLADAAGFTNEDFRRLFNVRSQLEAPAVNDTRRQRWRIVAKQGVPARFIDARADNPPR
jgi:hypothetical protein